MKKLYFIFSLTLFFIQPIDAQAPTTMFQVAPFSSLMVGLYQGFYSIGELSQKGDFGLGTFEGLNGEMVAFHGKYYYINQKGEASIAPPSALVPFAQVVSFQPASKIPIQNISTFEDFNHWMAQNIQFKNQSYAVLIVGQFNQVKLRSLRKQTQPYPDLVTASQTQVVYSFQDLSGYAVGFWSPTYWGTVTVEGTHLHFLNQPLNKGGHVLDFALETGTVYLMPIEQVDVFLPNHPAFNNANLNQATQELIQQVEGAAQN